MHRYLEDIPDWGGVVDYSKTKFARANDVGNSPHANKLEVRRHYGDRWISINSLGWRGSDMNALVEVRVKPVPDRTIRAGAFFVLSDPFSYEVKLDTGEWAVPNSIERAPKFIFIDTPIGGLTRKPGEIVTYRPLLER